MKKLDKFLSRAYNQKNRSQKSIQPTINQVYKSTGGLSNMATFLIHESNLEHLEKKLQAIKNKCQKNQFSFTYNVVGEEFKTTKNESSGEEYTARYVVVEVEGTVKHDGWRFIAVVDHHESGNVIRAYDTTLSVPNRYRHCGPECEHCNKIRSRKDTYIVYNEETQEFKQVGKSCLQEYTNGISAESVAAFIETFGKLEAAGGYSGSSFERYFELDEIVRYAFECVKHFGYEKAYDSFGDRNENSTRSRVSDYLAVNTGRCWLTAELQEAIKKEMEEVHFDADSEYAVESARKAVEWIISQNDDNEYMQNLKVICSDRYIKGRDFGLVCSLPAAYNRHLKNVAYEEKKAAERSAEKNSSKYQGEVGSRISINLKSIECISSWDNQFGTTWLYKMIDNEDNIYIWYASKSVDTDAVKSVTGTVKDHSEYDGVKQTVLTRCKVA